MRIEDFIKEKALEQGFVACGIAEAQDLPEERSRFEAYLHSHAHGEMTYLERNFDKRMNPRLLMENAESLIVVLYNYNILSGTEFDRSVARFARLDDYHKVIKAKLRLLSDEIKAIRPEAQMRAFVDTAPLLEKAWAIKAGLGWRGKNSLLINPEYGSFCNIGILLTSLKLETDNPIEEQCGTCSLCVDACPNGALQRPYFLDARKCIAYQTIELKEPDGSIDLHGWSYGCDICQDVCPWNRKKPS